MISNNLNTKSYVVINDSVQLSGSLIQKTLVNYGAKNIVISKETNNISSASNSIQTLSIGTPSTDYSSYQKISVGKTSDNYSKVIGIWGVNSPTGVNGQGGQLFKSASLTPFLFASPSTSDTNRLMGFIKQNKVYNIKSSNVSKVDGRSVISYQISINLKQYARLLNLYSSIMGYKGQTEPIKYTGSERAYIDISVGILSRQLIGLSFLGSSSVQIYSSYGINSPIKVPTKVISLQQLKNEIASLSK